ncbi:homoserine dehydrogenase [Desulfovibrio desulfuricans]|uniref:homoserine dehydrogenase n=1 Tax=Desulfovibrio desulfuricans TaxID=876 RepID=UPI001D064D13|nr:homoserine dehydrogenase [Desulfovibrio desulfuricans]MCB6541968.1 homoserine dehydrogenase [Desulfovibrio desulfuricans]MCB6553049.1 homoserine dehydrogenase [Desulfovibrio desulfuricans]MCB6565011.1 homoserine dehydrogenase [Desulfovibrio desulfuricans]MCB7346041.1 homoserine dehydrogenase [Desulfovibrio desulfuricans]MCQ4860774.1 homoserine dehydrogenase [Desulfovibrio desulfuricans]
MTKNSEKPLVVGLAGFGTVGGGLVRLLDENADLIRRRCGRDIVLKKVLVRNATKARSAQLPAGTELTTDYRALTDDPEIDVLVELIGGIDNARTIIDRALDQGKHIVTANKALLAEEGLALFQKADRKKRILRYEASVAGAIPIVETLKESLTGNRIESLMGILNGTSNYILSEMTSNGMDFDVALKQAQQLGYAEADPTLDIDGHDAAHKLILLIRLAYGVHYPYTALSVRGIRGLSGMDIRLAREFGYRIKLIGQVREVPGAEGAESEGNIRLEAGVFPALVYHKFLLARVGGVYNAVRVDANASGPLFFHGRGAGDLPTAGAVLGDLLAVARDERPNNTGFVSKELPKASIVPPEEWRSCYYVRVMVQDAPGVLRDLSGCMAAEGISMAQVIQKSDEGNGVPLVFMTHETTARAMSDALQRTMDAGLLKEPAVYFRVLGGA